MIGCYKYSRDYIVKKIKASKKTKDGYYFVNFFRDMNSKEGNDFYDRFYYNRSYFDNKIIFSDKDLNVYISSNKIEDFDINKMVDLDRKIFDVTKEFLTYDLYDKIPNYEFNLSDLIDATIFLYNHKY